MECFDVKALPPLPQPLPPLPHNPSFPPFPFLDKVWKSTQKPTFGFTGGSSLSCLLFFLYRRVSFQPGKGAEPDFPGDGGDGFTAGVTDRVSSLLSTNLTGFRLHPARTTAGYNPTKILAGFPLSAVEISLSRCMVPRPHPPHWTGVLDIDIYSVTAQ